MPRRQSTKSRRVERGWVAVVTLAESTIGKSALGKKLAKKCRMLVHCQLFDGPIEDARYDQAATFYDTITPFPKIASITRSVSAKLSSTTWHRGRAAQRRRRA